MQPYMFWRRGRNCLLFPPVEKMRPLPEKKTGLTWKRLAKDIQWMSECQVAIDCLKKVWTSSPDLVAPNSNWEFIVYIDVSSVSLKAVLC